VQRLDENLANCIIALKISEQFHTNPGHGTITRLISGRFRRNQNGWQQAALNRRQPVVDPTHVHLCHRLVAGPSHYATQIIIGLDFTVNRVLTKVFKASNVDIINDCRDMFDIKLPSVQLSQRFDSFIAK